VDQKNVGEALVTDVANYYSSVDFEVLDQLCQESTESRALNLIQAHLQGWRAAGGLGLPIEPEISGPLGNAYLAPTDRVLESNGCRIVRYTDDYLVFLQKGAAVADILREIDSSFAAHGLARSGPKTHTFPDPADALDHAENEMVKYLRRTGGRADQAAIRRAFSEALDEDPLDAPLIKFILGSFISTSDAYGGSAVINDLRLWRVDPRRCGEYLSIVLGRASPAMSDPIFEALRLGLRPAIALSMLRSLRRRTWGMSEGLLIESYVVDDSRHPLVRAEAVGAYASTPQWDPDDAVDLAISDAPTCCRRAATGSLARLPRDHTFKTKLERIAKCGHSTLAVTAAWVSGDRG